MKLFCQSTLAVLLIVGENAMAWGPRGHQVIANLAAAQLTPKARAAVDRILALEPGQTLASISTWADENREPATAAWHYVNFPKASCTYDPQRDCPDGNCVVAAIDRQMEILASAAPDEVKLPALKYLVHFVADVHQPLHAGYAEDRGGNSYQVQAFGAGSNLHAVWDLGLIFNLNMTAEKWSAKLRPATPPAQSLDLNASHAAEESCKVVNMSGFYPGRTVGREYLERFTPVLEQRIVLAGARLAGLLNQAFR